MGLQNKRLYLVAYGTNIFAVILEKFFIVVPNVSHP